MNDGSSGQGGVLPSALPSTTGDFVRHWAAEKPDFPALRWGDEYLTYGELDERSSRVAQALRAAGVGAGDRVAFLDKNSSEQVELFFGAAKLNAVPAPVNFRLAAPEIAVIVNDAGAKVFVVGEEFLPVVEKVAPDLGETLIVVIGESADRPSYAAWRDAQPATDPMVASAGEDVAYQLYSSGTTGRPKGVQLTQANLAAGLSVFPSLLGLGDDSVSMVAMPLYHIGGGGWALAGFRVGATNVLVRDIVPPDLVALVERERISHAFVVPAVLQFMLSVPGVADRDFSALRYFLYGASPISEKVLEGSMRTFGCRFVQAYGLTESTGMVVYLPETDHDLDGPNRHRLRGIGVPVPGMSARIVDPISGEDSPAGEVGEIWVHGPLVMKGYWHMPSETADTVVGEGWLRTGDAGYRDADGYLYVHDRVKDMIVSGGENVYPAEVENVLMSHPGVADVAVIGVPDDKWGETTRAVVVRVGAGGSGAEGSGASGSGAEGSGAGGSGAGDLVTEAELIAYCRERLAGFKCPTAIDWAGELPRNPSGKVLKKDLRAPYWAGRTRLVG